MLHFHHYAHEEILVPLARLAWDLDLELLIVPLILLIQSYLITLAPQFSDAAPHNHRDTNGGYRCAREKIQTHGLNLL